MQTIVLLFTLMTLLTFNEAYQMVLCRVIFFKKRFHLSYNPWCMAMHAIMEFETLHLEDRKSVV